jgi:hypothetical protein
VISPVTARRPGSGPEATRFILKHGSVEAARGAGFHDSAIRSALQCLAKIAPTIAGAPKPRNRGDLA